MQYVFEKRDEKLEQPWWHFFAWDLLRCSTPTERGADFTYYVKLPFSHHYRLSRRLFPRRY